MVIYSRRASFIIYNFILNNSNSGYWLLPLNSCPVVPITFFTAGIPFKFIDISLKNLCMSEKLIKKSIYDKNCTGLMYIYTYGHNQNKSELFKFIKNQRSDIKIIEDKCLSFPSFNENDASEYADITVYSTGYGKSVDIGYGGFAIAKPDITYEERRTNFSKGIYDNLESNYKRCLKHKTLLNKPLSSWLDDRSLPVTPEEYRKLVIEEEIISRKTKKEINNIFKRYIPESLWLVLNGRTVDDWRFNIKLNQKRDMVLKEIFNQNLFSSTHYKPVDRLFNSEVIGGNNNSYNLFNGIINLFNYKYIDAEMARRLADIINKC